MFGENQGRLIDGQKFGIVSGATVSFIVFAWLVWNTIIMLAKNNDIYRSGTLSNEANLKGEIDLYSQNWLMVFQLEFEGSDD